MLVQPAIRFGQHVGCMMHAVAQQRGSHECHFCPSQDAFQKIARTVHAPRDSKIGAHMAEQNGGPMQAEKEFLGAAESQ